MVVYLPEPMMFQYLTSISAEPPAMHRQLDEPDDVVSASDRRAGALLPWVSLLLLREPAVFLSLHDALPI